MINRILLISALLMFASYIYSQEKIKTGTVKNFNGIELVYVGAGSFVMGTDRDGDHAPARMVTLTKGFWIGKYEITQKLYREITGINPALNSRYGQGESLPVFKVNWYDAVEFCNLLSERHGLKPFYEINKKRADDDNKFEFDEYKWTVKIIPGANGFRLPTEAQWEYAARAGTEGNFYWGNSTKWDVSGAYAWHLYNAGKTRFKGKRFWWVKYHRYKNVGRKKPNSWGLYDMSGNVSEWCWDRYDRDYYKGNDVIDPAGPDREYSFRVKRGGSILDAPVDLASWKRWPISPAERSNSSGIRVVLPDDGIE